MKKIIKKAALILTFVMILCVSYNALSVSAEEDFKDMGTKVISNVNKVWTVKFTSPEDSNSLSNNISVQDLTDGSTVSVSASQGDDENSIKINPPSGGYKLEHKYKLTIDKNVKSKKQENLPKTVVLRFNVTSKDNNGYTASANVEVSRVWSGFKKITVSTTNLPDVVKYKIEGNNNFFNIGDTVTLISKDMPQISLYDNKDNLLGTATLDASSTKNNVSMNITLAD